MKFSFFDAQCTRRSGERLRATLSSIISITTRGRTLLEGGANLSAVVLVVVFINV